MSDESIYRTEGGYRAVLSFSKEEIDEMNGYLNWKESDGQSSRLQDDENIEHAVGYPDGHIAQLELLGNKDRAAELKVTLFDGAGDIVSEIFGDEIDADGVEGIYILPDESTKVKYSFVVKEENAHEHK